MPRRECDLWNCNEPSVEVVDWDKGGTDQTYVCAKHYDWWVDHWKKIEEE